MWNLGRDDAVVLLARVPPQVEYFSFTTFALFMPRRKPKPILPFASLGDSVNSANIKHSKGLFAHVVTSNQKTFDLVSAGLVASGLPASAINLVAVPSELGLFDDVFHLGGQVRLGTYFEVVLRLFRFANQTEGDAYLRSAQPVFYLRATHNEPASLPASAAPLYKSRSHPQSVREGALGDEFAAYSRAALAKAGTALGFSEGDAFAAATPPLPFTPLLIKGLECLEKDTECLGDCPDAAYYGPHVLPNDDAIRMLQLSTEDQVHLVTMVNHRQLKAATYGSVALLKPHPLTSPTLSKTRMSVRATSLGVTSFDFNTTSRFVSWAFTRSAAVCRRLEAAAAVHGCSIVEEAHVPIHGYLTYCERVYLNPVTGLGPDWKDLLPGNLYQFEARPPPPPPPHRVPRNLPLALPLTTITDGSDTMRFFHIIKSGGESLELHLAKQTSPKLDYSHCRRAGRNTGLRTNLTADASASCAAAAASVTSILCAANCECCAADTRVEGGFHGTLIRSPRAHMLSLFSHCHTAHTKNTWARALDDVPQYLAEIVLRSTEWSCGTYCGVSFEPEWHVAIRAALAGDVAQHKTLRVLPLHNTQAHAMTCSTARGSLGQHMRVLDGSGDALAPSLDAALAAVRRFEWVGLTDLYDQSVCLLHYQANGTLPTTCDCRASHGPIRLGLPRMNHGVRRHDAADLPADVLRAIDAHTAVDAQLFAEALRLLLGRLRTLEDATGRSLLACIDWGKLWRATGHIDGLWESAEAFVPQ